MFLNFIEKLKERLQDPLPGQEAQDRMRASIRKPENFDLGWKEPARPGAVLILLYPTKEGVFFPLMKRSDYGGVHSGQISLPGGKREAGDKDLLDTAARETHEEIGVAREDIQIIGTISELYVYASNFDILPVIAYSEKEPLFDPDTREVVEVVKGDQAQLTSQQVPITREIQIRNISIQAPYFEIEGHVVWGATAMILSEFLEIVAPIQTDLKLGQA